MEQTPTRAVRIGKYQVGAGAPIVVQSMCATKTTNIDATVAQVNQLEAAGAGVVRIAVDNPKEAAALKRSVLKRPQRCRLISRKIIR
jgi:(E)-4-hydroxy-3-methylbut-2-enyl-diphosphate synthase